MFRALRVTRDPSAVELLDLDDDSLGEGDVTVDVEFSSLNFKDGMALAGRPGVAKIDPLIPGIDLVGSVRTSDDPRWQNGDRVVLNGWGIGETHNGGLSERARVSGDWLVALPDAISPKRAAAIGTAGFTAMLAVLALERNGALATRGDILVTGAAGGVGSIAIALLSGLGHRVVASTGRLEETDYLKALGAAEVIDRTPFGERGKPLQSQRFAGAIDSVGGTTLANVLAQTNYGGTVASCGLAAGADLPATVMPFILRAVTLTGINSVFAPSALRAEAWSRLASDLDLDLLDGLTTTIGLTDAAAHATEILDGKVRGRIVVDVHA
jgi:acrylyl-CoA reductase (NADPH)